MALTFSQIHGQKLEKSSKGTFQNEDYDLNKGEFYTPSEDKFNDELRGYKEDFGHKINQKNPFKSQIQNGQSHYETLRPDAVQPVKKYVVKKPESFNQDVKGMKFSTSVGKPMKMKAKVVQKGSVKHIYLDIPDTEPLPQPSMPKGIRYSSPNYNNFEGGNYFHKQPVHYQHQSFSHGGFNNYGGNFGPQQSFGHDHGFGGVSGGFRVGKAQFQPAKNVGSYSTYGSQFGGGIKYPPSQYNKFKPIPPPDHSHGNNFNHIHQQYAAPQNYQHGSFGGYQFGQGHQQVDNFGAPHYQGLSQGEHQIASEPTGDFGNSHSFPEFSQDGKEKFTYEIPKEYQHLFAGQGGHATLTEQSTNQVPKVLNNFGLAQQTHQPQQSQEFQQPAEPQQQQFYFDFKKETNPLEQQIQQPQQLQYDFSKGVNQFEQAQQQQFQYDFKGPEYLPKPVNLFSTQAQQFNTGKGNEQTNFQQNEFLPQPEHLVQFPQSQQFEQFKQSESINNQNFGETTDFMPKPAPEQYNAQQYNSGSFEVSKPITEYGQSTEFIPKVAPNFQFNQQHLQQQLDAQQKTPGLENVSGFDPDLVNIVNNVINKGEGIPTSNGFRMVKSNENNAIYLVGKPGMSLDTIPNFGGFKPSDFQLNNNENSQRHSEDPNNEKVQ